MKQNADLSLVTITNRKGLSVQLSNYGARILSVQVPIGNRLLEVHDYQEDHTIYERSKPFVGATIGPLANRLKPSSYTLDGRSISFAPPHEGFVLHSGLSGFHLRYWTIQDQSENMVVFELNSRSNEVIQYKILVTFMITDDNGMLIQFEAKSDQAIHINMTSHGFFNLSERPDLSTHTFQILSDQITSTDHDRVSTGEKENINGSFLDLRVAQKINPDLYDHNYILDKSLGQMGLAAVVYAEDTRLTMHSYTTQPGLQFYTRRMDAFCLETQHFPNSPHINNFPSTLISPDSAYKEQCVYRFSHATDVFNPFDS